MKFASIIVFAVATFQSTHAMPGYLDNLPNGGSFTKDLGHINGGDPNTDFGKAYSAAGGAWGTLCPQKFPGSDMTNGEAFGDPCCVWTKGGTPQETVTPFTTTPTTKTVCAAAGGDQGGDPETQEGGGQDYQQPDGNQGGNGFPPMPDMTQPPQEGNGFPPMPEMTQPQPPQEQLQQPPQEQPQQPPQEQPQQPPQQPETNGPRTGCKRRLRS